MSELKTTKKYCAVNTKYYKDGQASGEIGHVLRSFKNNENCFPSLTKNNFGHTFSDHKLNLKQYYDIKPHRGKGQQQSSDAKKLKHLYRLCINF